MAVNAPADFSPNSFRESGTPTQYISLGNFINEVDIPDNRERLVMTYGDQAVSTIYGLLYMVGAVKAGCLLYTSPSPRDRTRSRMPSSA